MQPLPLSQSIIHTLAFFDIFEHGLTAQEVHTYLWRGGVAEERSTRRSLEELVQSEKIVYDRGYYGLRPTADMRIHRIPYITHKRAIVDKAVRILRYVPFIRAVCVCNNLALETVHADSDVDVFIVTRTKRIWTARLFATLFLRIARLARTRYRSIDKVCLSFYVTDDALDMSSITLGTPDIYLMYWVRTLLPLYDPDQLYGDIQKNNSWIIPYIHTIEDKLLSSNLRIDRPRGVIAFVTRLCERMWQGIVGDLIEQQAKELQQTKMKFRFESVRDEPDSRVIVSDTMLKFHEQDRREQYRKEWEASVLRHTH